MDNNKITLIGAGLSGPLMATYLTHHGYNVDIYEKRSDMRIHNLPAGRSINLALSIRGIRALKEVGVYEEIKPLMIPMKGRMIHDLNGKTTLHPYGQRNDEVIYSISRSKLNKKLITVAEQTGKVQFFFEHDLIGADLINKLLFFNNSNEKSFTRVIGCDGSSSALRNEIINKTNAKYLKEPLGHAYKELTIPPSSNEFRIEPHALHIWPRGNFMLIALPNMDKSFTCTLFMPTQGDTSFETLESENDVTKLFKTHFADVLELIPSLHEEFIKNPIGELATIYLNPWHFDESAALIGDAAHAIVPFFGQGMNASFQDCTILNQLIKKYNNNWKKIFSSFSNQHVKNGHAIADMAIENYEEMRDSVNKSKYQAQRKLEFALEQRIPNKFIPRYSMVSFSEKPYSEVYKKGEKQYKLLNTLLELDPTGETIDSTIVNNFIN
jgi:kynurenine 3-monooxygenase